MPSKMLQTEIQPLSIKSAGPLTFSVYVVRILEVLASCYRQRRDLGANSTRAEGPACRI